MLTPPATISSSTFDIQNGKNNSKKFSSGSGFGSMSQWSGPGHGTGSTGRNNDLSDSISSSHNGKDAAMLSDLPRKVSACDCVCVSVSVCGCVWCLCVCVFNHSHSLNYLISSVGYKSTNLSHLCFFF